VVPGAGRIKELEQGCSFPSHKIWPVSNKHSCKIKSRYGTSERLKKVLPLLHTWIIDLLADKLLWVGTASCGNLAAAGVDAPALTRCHVALFWTELAAVGALRHVRRRSVLLAGLDLLPMTLAQNADSTCWQWHDHRTTTGSVWMKLCKN